MESPLIQAKGEITPADDLTVPKARDLAVRLQSGEISHASFIECRKSGSEETVVFNVRPEVPNQRVHQILREERIGASFTEADQIVPKVEVLRADFPRVPHLNLNQQEIPASLCLYNEPYSELKRSWTSARFVRRIREWLELTSKGRLHPDDQRLEPLLVDFAGHIVLPEDIDTIGNEQLYVDGFTPKGRKWFLRVHRKKEAESRGPAILFSLHTCQSQVHGTVRRAPATLLNVIEMAEEAGLDLIGELRERLPGWRNQSIDSRIALVLVFPKTRTAGQPPEESERWCFLTVQTVGELSISLGLWGEEGGMAALLLEPDDSMRGQDVPVLVLNPSFELTRKSAARLNGLPEVGNVRIVGVGAGALGSQMVMNISRSGFGRWTLIDHDRLMPHNLARHALASLVGHNKAEAVAYLAGGITTDEDSYCGLDAELQENRVEIHRALASADVIVDMTASVAVQRYIARTLVSPARRLSTFLTPSGADMVFLAEDAQRHVKLDALEMQYYRSLLHDDAMAGHLLSDDNRHRYGRSCGDISSALPQDLVALHAAIGSRKLKEIIANDAAFCGVWRIGSDSTVSHVDLEVCPVTEFSVGDWTVVIDDGLRYQLTRSRNEKLPCETGGVLLGSFDLEHNTLYLVDTLPSPPDSEEQRDLYIRGCQGLRKAVDDVETKTGGMLEYVGEWHSHPTGASTMPSRTDREAFASLTELMSTDGLPAVMLIVGDAPEPSLFVDEMSERETSIPRTPDELA